jgi:hypothetical protein
MDQNPAKAVKVEVSPLTAKAKEKVEAISTMDTARAAKVAKVARDARESGSGRCESSTSNTCWRKALSVWLRVRQ